MKYRLIYKNDYDTDLGDFRKQWEMDIEAESVMAFDISDVRINHISANFSRSVINVFLAQVPERIDRDTTLNYFRLRKYGDAYLNHDSEIYWYPGIEAETQTEECGDMSALVGMEES